MITNRGFRKQKVSSSLIVFLLIILLLVLVNFVRGTMKYLSTKKEIQKRNLEIETLEKKLAELKEREDLLKTEFYKEKVARENFGFMKAGERVIIISPSKEISGEVESLKEKKSSWLGPNFKNWWQYFFK
jgi:cell division protein FtsB